MHRALRLTLRAAMAMAAVFVAAPAAMAQIPGMPLYTNPRYGSGIRVHADVGGSSEKMIGNQVMQGGVSLALGPVGFSASVGSTSENLASLSTCASRPSVGCERKKISASALGQFRVIGDGNSFLTVALFGGVATDLSMTDAIDCSTFTGISATVCNIDKKNNSAKRLTIPVGASLSAHIPLLITSLNVWAAPRYSFNTMMNCPDGANCGGNGGDVRVAVGADMPILGLFAIRAAYDMGKIGGQNANFWGLGGSIGFGGVH
jgi:hypothetical protein